MDCLSELMSQFNDTDLISIEEALIDQVRDRPWLYDSGLADYKDAEKKENSWREIAEHLKLDVNEVKKKWKSLRSSFAREKKLGPSGSAAKPKKEWVYMQAMSFLHGHVKEKRQTYCNIREEQPQPSQLSRSDYFDMNFDERDPEEGNTTRLEENERAVGDNGIHTVTTPVTSRGLEEGMLSNKTRRKRKNDAIIQALDSTDRFIKKFCEEPDEDENFCNLIKGHLKDLDKKKKIAIQIKVLSVIQEELNKD